MYTSRVFRTGSGYDEACQRFAVKAADMALPVDLLQRGLYIVRRITDAPEALFDPLYGLPWYLGW